MAAASSSGVRAAREPTLEPWLFGLMKTGQRHRDFVQPTHQLARGRWHAVQAKAFLGFFLVDRNAARVGVGAGVGDATRCENILNLSVLAEGPVHREEREIGARRHNKVFVIDDHLGHFVARLAQGFRGGSSGAQRHVALGGGSAFQHRDSMRFVAHFNFPLPAR